MRGVEDQKLAGIRRIAAHFGERLNADISLKLWDGSVVPLAPAGLSDVALVIRSPAAIRRLIFSPRLRTFFGLLAAGELDIEGGSLIEAFRRIDHQKALRIARSLDKRLLLKSLWPFVFTAPGESALTGYRSAVAERAEGGRDDKRLVQFHYDVSNAFYATFLGKKMVYSCAYFERPDATLDEAQDAKLEMVCRRLRLKPGERFLDIGCGWGALICHAAERYGVEALGVTLSQQQFDYVRERIRARGLANRVAVELCDYREAKGTFDKISQIELFEHIGLANKDLHFDTIHRLLRRRGLYLHHSCTRRLSRDPKKWLRTRSYQEFLSDFVLPGTELDHIGSTLDALERHGFEVHDVENWREHFLRTAELWASGLAANRQAAQAIVGYQKTRLWLLFFSIFALAFERNACLVFQTLASRRGVGSSAVPLTRADLYS
jgi:cyclopropane-fatty-acyl-phospholipid synthase